MKMRWMLWTIALVAMGLNSLLFAEAKDRLAADFTSPPETTRPRCYWYWMQGRISKEGITKDLEAMRRVGIGEAYIGIIGGGSGRNDIMPSVKTFSDDWWGCIEHAIREGTRLGVDIGQFNCPGWSQSGGPWVKPEQSMRYLVFSETRLTGPQRYEGKLPMPAGAIQDVAVLAFAAPQQEGQLATITRRTPSEILFETAAPFTARSLVVHPSKTISVKAELEASDDGQTFRTVNKFSIERHWAILQVGPVPLAPVAVSFPATSARFFRLKFSEPCEVGEVQLSPAIKVERFAEKSLIKVYGGGASFGYYTWPQQPEADLPAIPAAGVVNLSDKTSADGTLRWEVPAGEWIVLRAAMAPTGIKNGPAPIEGAGLEVDKMNRAALKSHFDAYMGEFLRRIPAADRKAWKHVVADSWEVASQNWTDGFAADFQKRYGYDPLAWLPAMGGRVVGSVDQSDRFLWDLRRLVADRIAEDYVGGLRDLCHEHSLKLWVENYGAWGYPSEFLKYGGQCHEISGEFWMGVGDKIEVRDAASAGHTYGKPVVWAEAFTSAAAFRTPRELKARGDWAYCQGINQFVLHVYFHQPCEDKKPGVNASYGTEFNRHNTWFEYAKPWIDYQRRCSVMLQAGLPVADVAYFITEDTPKMDGPHNPILPMGHDYDYINADVIENRLTVKNGRFVLPDGTSYRLLVLPESKTMRPGLLKKIQQLVADGGAVFGSAPERSPSLANYPACDAEVKRIAGELWDSGRVMTGTDLKPAFAKLQLTPDVKGPEGILWKHRRTEDADIYFLSNQQDKQRTEQISFRVDGRMPELWWPETGRMEEAPAFSLANGRVEVPVQLNTHESVFVVFRKKADTGRIAAKSSSALKASEIAGPWKLEFPGKQITFDKLVSWTENVDSAIKYFSGEATYRNTFQVSDPSKGVTLDLGTVHAIAKVCVNGQEVGIAWKEPYRLDITKAVKPGANELAVTVVNTWNNRLVGDLQPGVKDPVAYITCGIRNFSAKTPLQPSGLLGPVRVMQEE